MITWKNFGFPHQLDFNIMIAVENPFFKETPIRKPTKNLLRFNLKQNIIMNKVLQLSTANEIFL